MAVLRVRPIDPLEKNVPIVDEKGRPTPTFMRQWILARNVNLTTTDVTISLEELQLLITELQAQLLALQGLQIIAGVGLSGGGFLVSDVTLNLLDTGVTPGTYGSATHVPRITVNAYGQITAVTEEAI